MPESGKTLSAWTDVARPEFTQLTENISCDVCVIGAGITGLTCAYALAKEGKKVVVLDAGKVVCGETQRTTAHISDVVDDSYQEIERIYGKDKMRLIKESLTASIQKIESIISNESIDCDYSRLEAFLWETSDTYEKDPDFLKKEREASLNAGFPQVDFIDSFEIIDGAPRALRFPAQAQFHVVKYLNGICNALKAMGVQIYQESRVEKIDPKDAPTATLKNKTTVTAKDIVVATNGPIIDFSIQTKQIAYRTYVIAMKIKKGSIPDALYWDTEEPYHYVRKHPIDGNTEEELLVAGGEDHRVGEANDGAARFARLEQWTRSTFVVDGEIEYRWSGQVYEPTDALGFIGQDPELGKHIYVATGDSGMGVTNGTIAALLLTDLIAGRENPWTEIYSLGRQTPKALGNYIGESMHSLSHYKDNIVTKTVEEQDIHPGEGGIIERGGKKLAAYRESTEAVKTVSPYCTHLGGVVCWNSCESSWDCPVHGSRFTADGEVIYGPADGDLKPA
jgi:glycine/D-amino acid oxidase-like deaminating enzyme/nitrite reductase/ring-hydroxylating ferredoxin subunit